MPTEEEMLRHVQMLALAQAVTWLLASEFRRAGEPAAAADELLRRADALAAVMTLPEAGPAWSDLAAQEFGDSLRRLILRSRALATGEPVDPDAFRNPAP